VDHGFEAVGREELREWFALGDVQAREAEFRVGFQALEARFLQADVVVGAEVVDAVD
jgi:hypothetical protein